MKYNRTEAALRIRNRRKALGLTSAEVAEKIGRADHYYGDIERGTCGMSIDTPCGTDKNPGTLRRLHSFWSRK
nr:helix-turn-helix transcriptional regulator [Hungatella hathewayi]